MQIAAIAISYSLEQLAEKGYLCPPCPEHVEPEDTPASSAVESERMMHNKIISTKDVVCR